MLELIRGKKVMVGAIDVATNKIETPEEVANTLREALKYVDADKLYPCTNCGMAPLSRKVSTAKLNALSAGAEIRESCLLKLFKIFSLDKQNQELGSWFS